MTDMPAKPGASFSSRRRSSGRKAINLSDKGVVDIKPIDDNVSLPIVFEAKVKGLSLPQWAARNKEMIEKHILKHGAVLFRGFNATETADLNSAVEAISGEAIPYRERSSPRSQVEGNVYTSTDHPSEQVIFPHNEHSYSLEFPLRLYFMCKNSGSTGGETPLADCRKIYKRLDPKIKQRFEDKKWMFVRNYDQGFGLTCATAFQTTDRAKIEAYCRNNKVDYEWIGDRLRTTQVRETTIRHPHSKEWSWFNHLTFYHVTTLPAALRDSLLHDFAMEDLPNNTYYGDGSPIEDSVLDELRGLYLEECVAFPWQERDIMIIDNVLSSHSRNPYTGPRQIWLAMAEPIKR